MSKLEMNLLFPARAFRKMIEMICDHHKLWNNFCKIKNNLEECPCNGIVTHEALKIFFLLTCNKPIYAYLRHLASHFSAHPGQKLICATPISSLCKLPVFTTR